MSRWTHEEDDTLKSQYTSGNLGIVRKLADILRRSRNAVIGRANRLGLSRPKESWTQDELPRIQRQQRPKAAFIFMQKQNCPSDIAYDQLWTWAADRTFIADLKEYHCRWPVGEMEFCGGPKLNGHAYCEAHCRFAYTKQPASLRTEPFFRTAVVR
jgi:GcrA cell cycle regulator